jgi:23S rRNA (guanine745-N1)-methyltransferase
MAHPLICPICHGALQKDGGCYRCPRNHSYDISRFGYTNLLSGKAAGQHGDNREMILARRRFLDSGAYAPLRDALCEAVKEIHPAGGIYLDAGCGECYYTDGVAEALGGLDCIGYGIDISREALRAAAIRPSIKRGDLSLFVSGVYEMPFADASIDTVINLFAPLAVSEYLRVLKDGGHLVMAIPDKRHLFSLKEVLYDTPKENAVADFALEGFSLLSASPIETTFTLQGQAIQDLFAMTPYYYRTPQAGKERLAKLDSLTTKGAFILLLYQKAPEEYT